MFKDLPAKCYQKNKERLQIEQVSRRYQDLREGFKIFQEKKKVKSENMFPSNKKIFLGIKNKGFLSIKKKYYEV